MLNKEILIGKLLTILINLVYIFNRMKNKYINNTILKSDILKNREYVFIYSNSLIIKDNRSSGLPTHPYHMVSQSPWPLGLSGVLLSLTISAVLTFHGYPMGNILLICSFILLNWGMALWFKDIVSEASFLGFHTDKVQKGISLGVVLWASVSIFIKLIKIRESRTSRRMHDLSYIRVNNLIVCKNRETIACHVKRKYEEVLTTWKKYSKTIFEFKNLLGMTLYLWNVSFFWQHAVTGGNESRKYILYILTEINYKKRKLNSGQTWNSFSEKSNEEVYLLFRNYLLALGTGNENTSKEDKEITTIKLKYNKLSSSVINVTGEIQPITSYWLEVRGFIVMKKLHNRNLFIKEPKSRFSISRAYSTSSKKKSSLHSLVNENQSEDLGLEKIARLWITNYKKPNKIYENLKGILKIKELWYASYIKIRSRKGSETPGIDFKTLDGTTKEKLELLANKVIKGKYEWKPIKRVGIPKSNGKTRFLGIPSLEDRIVQEVIRSILEPIYEPTFSWK